MRRDELLPGVTLERSEAALVIRAADPLDVLSSAVLGGGRRRARTILNLRVPRGYDCERPERDLRRFARAHDLDAPVVGLMTAVPVREGRVLTARGEGILVRALVTVGLANATRAGTRSPAVARVAGTINAIFLCDARLHDAAAIELVALAAEAKAATLVDAAVLTSGGDVATGTSTDSVVIAWPRAARRRVRYSGSATAVGDLVARLMREAIEAHLARTGT